ncbi:protein SENESCENCE-ASSOCIATED GENE 21, mitochondrial-like [Eucalyptus grandis]|uniref:protein SENESCENCE-ASSOCIATED GENE 21, mitochondrial-like n=1 Tax=Eucalyptus grandis TaxID=71139 RepID=UPI0008A0F25A|nr:protein SENESCENCE-ASSOCIATED GENE 21, mitochondrial-like [Eucalyptus grandis]
MAKAPVNGILLLSQRSYGALAEKKAAAAAAAGTMRKAAEEEEDEKKKVFWMRDPKSGNWIPESHFDKVDAAELREKFLSKKKGHL